MIEGTGGNIGSLEAMSKVSRNPAVSFVRVAGAGHFDVLGPTNTLIAARLLEDTGEKCELTLTEEEVEAAFASQ